MKPCRLFSPTAPVLLAWLVIMPVTALAFDTPANFHVTRIIDTEISLAWDDLAGESGYEMSVTVVQPDGQVYTSVTTLAPDTTTYTEGTQTPFVDKYSFSLSALYNNNEDKSDSTDILNLSTTHHWSGELLKCANLALGYGSVDTHTPTKTELLSLDQFRCTYKSINSMEPVRDLQNLSLLDLQHNSISQLPAWIGELNLLNHLVLTANAMTNQIPDSLWNLHSLQFLDLADNGLQGTLSSRINELTGLQTLYLNNNNLSGALPADWQGLQTNLNWLFLNDNQFSGSIPADLGSCQALAILHLENNQFSGEIPASLGQLPWITVLRLDNNQLSGTIPSWIGGLTTLGALYLSENYFTGIIPAEIVNLTGLDGQYGLKLDQNDCLNSDGNTAVEQFIDDKASEFGGYAGVVDTNRNCPKAKGGMAIPPVLELLLEKQ